MAKNKPVKYRQNNQYSLSLEGKQASVALFKRLMNDCNINEQDIADRLNISVHTLNNWLICKNSINPNKLGDIVSIFQSSGRADDNDLLMLARHVRPYMANEEGWLEGKIQERNYEHLNFPAFDLKWLETQDDQNYLPWLVAAHRIKADFTQQEVGESVGRKQTRISGIEKALYKVTTQRLMEELDVIHLTAEEKRVILERRFNQSIKAVNIQQVAGKYLRGYRDLLGLTIEDTVKGTGISRKLIMKMEAGERPIDADSEAAFITFFNTLKETKTGVLFDKEAEARILEVCCAAREKKAFQNSTTHFGCFIPTSAIPVPEHANTHSVY